MSKQIFYYGTMNASKSAQLLMQNYNYKEQGLRTCLIKPSIDTRDSDELHMSVVSSRVGLKEKANWTISPEDSGDTIRNILYGMWTEPSVILVDECQFLNNEQIMSLADYCRINEVELHAFGLLKDFQNNLFEGSKTWLETSDNIIEIKTTCSKCTRKATCNLRLNNGNPTYDGNVVEIGGNESYVSVCREHYYNYD